MTWGLCFETQLWAIEDGSLCPDKLLMDVLIQRLGKSSDKLEVILNAKMYKMEQMRDAYEELLERRKREEADNRKGRTSSRQNWV